jgi:phosphopantetheine adenylyltransferase
VLESLSERMRSVRQFLEMFKPSLVYEIVPIHDVYGPTAADPNIQALVVSMETASGGKAGA